MQNRWDRHYPRKENHSSEWYKRKLVGGEFKKFILGKEIMEFGFVVWRIYCDGIPIGETGVEGLHLIRNSDGKKWANKIIYSIQHGGIPQKCAGCNISYVYKKRKLCYLCRLREKSNSEKLKRIESNIKKFCTRCSSELHGNQIKYCSDCKKIVHRELARDSVRRRREHNKGIVDEGKYLRRYFGTTNIALEAKKSLALYRFGKKVLWGRITGHRIESILKAIQRGATHEAYS